MKIWIIFVDKLSGGGQGSGVGSGGNRGNYQTLLKMSEKTWFLLLVPRHSHYVQQRKQYNQTIKPLGEYILFGSFVSFEMTVYAIKKRASGGNTSNGKR